MSNSRGGGSGGGSRAALRKKVETPRKTGVEFEATVQGDAGGASAASTTETFTYEEVSDLATVTPAEKRAGRGEMSKAVAKVSRVGGQQAQEKLGNGKRPELVAHQAST